MFLCFPSQGEGVAYRGRVLVELSSKLDEKVDKRVVDISSDDILLAQVKRDLISIVLVLHVLFVFHYEAIKVAVG